MKMFFNFTLQNSDTLKLGKYIHDLLPENETVIVPGFGAFITVYKPAEIGETEIKPPSKQISFSQNIRNNDGLLVGHVATSEQISHFDALKLIEKERDNIVFQLDKGNEVTLEKIGKLFFSNNNEIKFVPDSSVNISMDNFGLETISLEKLNEMHFEPEVENIIAPAEESVFEPIEENVSNDTEKEVHSEENNEFHLAEVENINEIESQEEIVEASVEELTEKEKDDKQETDSEPIFVANNEVITQKKEKKEKRWYWYLLILVPVIIAGFFVFRNASNKNSEATNFSDDVKSSNPQNEIQTEESNITTNDSLEITQEEIIPQDGADIVINEDIANSDSISNQPGYYLIGGSFKESEENAITYMEELKEKGFNPFYIGKIGSFYTVGIGKFETEGQAVRERDTIWSQYPGWNLWVMKK